MTQECPAHLVQKRLQNFSTAMIWTWYVVEDGSNFFFFCKEAFGHYVSCTQLLWRTWQCKWHDECGENTNGAFLDFKSCREKEDECLEILNTAKGYDHKASKKKKKEKKMSFSPSLVGKCNI